MKWSALLLQPQFRFYRKGSLVLLGRSGEGEVPRSFSPDDRPGPHHKNIWPPLPKPYLPNTSPNFATHCPCKSPSIPSSTPLPSAPPTSAPTSGLREGNIPHAEVNTVLRTYPKTVIFGQQTRLRNGVLLPDEKLPRFHAGHDIVKFFYGAVRQLPAYLSMGCSI